MSFLGDLARRSGGSQVRGEDQISSIEDLLAFIKSELESEKRIKEGNKDLDEILQSLCIELPSDEKKRLFEIEDKGGLLSTDELFLLQTSLILPFYLLKGSYSSLEDILIRGGVRVIIDPRKPQNKDMRKIPAELDNARRYWKKMVEENPNDDFARKMLAEVLEEIAIWEQVLILGLYKPTEKIILLFPNNMRDIDKGNEMPKLLVSTLAHEVMHAYFDRTPLDNYPYVYSIEEPMAEFGMLLYLKETYQMGYFDWAKGFVGGKKSCYRYGSALMEQCEKEGSSSQTRKDFELYKIVGSTFTFHMMSSPSPVFSGKAKRIYKINGAGRYSMRQVIEEYIKYKLDGGFPFNSIFSVGKMFISTIPTGVSIGSQKTAKPYSFTYKGKDYYVTTQLRDNGPTDNFQKFRTAVSKNEPGFQITVF